MIQLILPIIAVLIFIANFVLILLPSVAPYYRKMLFLAGIRDYIVKQAGLSFMVLKVLILPLFHQPPLILCFCYRLMQASEEHSPSLPLMMYIFIQNARQIV